MSSLGEEKKQVSFSQLTIASPLALIIPSKSHPEVIIQAVSARDRQKAEAFANTHSIPEIKDTYQGEIDKELRSYFADPPSWLTAGFL